MSRPSRIGLPFEFAPRDVVGVVQRRVLHDDAADRHRQQPRHRRQRAGAADLDVDRLELGRGALGGELVRQRPARRRRAEAEPRLQVEPVDLVDDAVDVVAERRALALDQPVAARASSSTLVAATISGLVAKPSASSRAMAAVWVSASGSESSPQA